MQIYSPEWYDDDLRGRFDRALMYARLIHDSFQHSEVLCPLDNQACADLYELIAICAKDFVDIQYKFGITPLRHLFPVLWLHDLEILIQTVRSSTQDNPTPFSDHQSHMLLPCPRSVNHDEVYHPSSCSYCSPPTSSPYPGTLPQRRPGFTSVLGS